MRDSTAIIFFQVMGQTVRIIDTYENTDHGLEHYISILREKPYTYGNHFAPHDIAVRELGTGLSRIEKARQLGIEFQVAPNLSVIDGIEAVRSSLGRIWIDETRCKQLIISLENYRKEFDAKKKIYHDKPLHDHTSHFCDATRYLCLCLSKTSDGMTPKDLERIRNEALYGESSSGGYNPFSNHRRY
jgi:hypothetical protein